MQKVLRYIDGITPARDPKQNRTYRTKLKLDKEVGGGDFSELCTVTYLITYPYAWTVNFEIWNLRFKHRGTKYGMLLTTHQPPIAKASQTSAWSHRYIGNWVSKTEGSPIGFIPIFWRLKSWKNPLAKVVDFEHLGALFGLGGLEADLTPIWRSHGRRVTSHFAYENGADFANIQEA